MNGNTIGARVQSRSNYFTAIRIFLAACVALSHCWIVFSGRESPDPFAFRDLTLSYMAVNGFFVLSGFFIAKSLHDRRDLLSYAWSRFLRIMPALAVIALSAVFLIGPLASGMPVRAALADPDTYAYPLNVLSFVDTRGGPPGFAPDNPYKGEFAGTLWTLRYEALAYIGAGAAFATGLVFRKGPILIVAGASAALFIVLTRTGTPAFLPESIWVLTRFMTAFLIGCAAYVWRDHIPLRLDMALLLTLPLLVIDGRAESEIIATVALGYWIFLAGAAPRKNLKWLTSVDDISYGLYIWHWPVMQILLWRSVVDQPLHMALTAIPISALIAYVSWRLIEKPALSLKGFSGRFRKPVVHVQSV
ncbi:acyltransferase family protein [Euryhalocaulis caribicus]|uniref:acyltransferase family protein n=1 Tax=Euryhalocaulis caribicus TaxID=1161401 RepID=UPI0003A83E78|nr:acyltransferase [Euryhalocaulis caribicus]